MLILKRFRPALLAPALLAAALGMVTSPAAQAQQPGERPFVLAIHGGAGTILRDAMTPEQERAYRAALREALEAGHRILREGGSSLDAVVAAVTRMEDSPLFNAGKGAVFTSQATVELDASIMDGRARQAGAVAAVQRVKNPIRLARQVMEQSPHVMLVGEGAETFAEQQGLEQVPNTYFHTERRRQALEQARQAERKGPSTGALTPGLHLSESEPHTYGTVGAVALDQDGNLAAATSTGGMTNKRYGRVGDSPIIGAGTYAHNETCAVSATGHGEYFIRGVLSHDIAARMRYGGVSLQEAAETAVMTELTEMGGTGGVIAVDREGRVAMPFNTEGMYRGVIDAQGNARVMIFKDES